MVDTVLLLVYLAGTLGPNPCRSAIDKKKPVLQHDKEFSLKLFQLFREFYLSLSLDWPCWPCHLISIPYKTNTVTYVCLQCPYLGMVFYNALLKDTWKFNKTFNHNVLIHNVPLSPKLIMIIVSKQNKSCLLKAKLGPIISLYYYVLWYQKKQLIAYYIHI